MLRAVKSSLPKPPGTHTDTLRCTEYCFTHNPGVFALSIYSIAVRVGAAVRVAMGWDDKYFLTCDGCQWRTKRQIQGVSQGTPGRKILREAGGYVWKSGCSYHSYTAWCPWCLHFHRLCPVHERDPWSHGYDPQILATLKASFWDPPAAVHHSADGSGGLGGNMPGHPTPMTQPTYAPGPPPEAPMPQQHRIPPEPVRRSADGSGGVNMPGQHAPGPPPWAPSEQTKPVVPPQGYACGGPHCFTEAPMPQQHPTPPEPVRRWAKACGSGGVNTSGHATRPPPWGPSVVPQEEHNAWDDSSDPWNQPEPEPPNPCQGTCWEDSWPLQGPQHPGKALVDRILNAGTGAWWNVLQLEYGFDQQAVQQKWHDIKRQIHPNRMDTAFELYGGIERVKEAFAVGEQSHHNALEFLRDRALTAASTRALVERILQAPSGAWRTVLNLPESVDRNTVRRSFHKVALQLHPDKVPPDVAHFCGGRDSVQEAFVVACTSSQLANNFLEVLSNQGRMA